MRSTFTIETCYQNRFVRTRTAVFTLVSFQCVRIVSDPVEGSASVNLATHYDGFDIETNFSIYDLDVETGAYHVIRRGSRDQSS